MEINNGPQNQPHSYRMLHFGDQCPWRQWVVEQAKEAAQKTVGAVEVLDISDHPKIARHYRLFFPFMTVIDEKYYIPSPTPAEQLVKIAQGGITLEPLVIRPSAPEAHAEMVVPLTAENIGDTCCLCIPPELTAGCRAKQAWAHKVADKASQGILGFAAYQGRNVVGVVEYLTSIVIPYPLPEKDPTLAFITCVYSNEDQGAADYRGQVLDRLLEYLPSQGFRKVQVIAGQRTAYPNGPTPFFVTRGFEEVKTLGAIVLGDGEEELVLMEKVV